MVTITLPNDVILDVLRFFPYENSTKLVLTNKSWVKPLQVQMKEQRSAIITEIRRLECIDLGEKDREINSNYRRMVENEKRFRADLETDLFRASNHLKQVTAIALFNLKIEAVQDIKHAAYIEYCAIARKRQPVIDKILSLKSKLDQRGKSKTERFADLNHRQKRYQATKCATFVYFLIAFTVSFGAIVIALILLL